VVGVPVGATDKVIGKVRGDFRYVAPLGRVGGSAKGLAQGDEEELGDEDHGLDRCRKMEVDAPISGLPVDFGEADALGRMVESEEYDEMDESNQCMSIPVGG
jgi:hypothetical protein